MWVEEEAGARMRDRVREAEQARLAATARTGGPGRTGTRRLAGYGWRLRQAAGFGLVRTGLRLLDARRA
jgi:hypothetical protein